MKYDFNTVVKTHDGLPVAMKIKGEIKNNCTVGDLVFDALMYPAAKFDEMMDPPAKRMCYDVAVRIKNFPHDLSISNDELNLIRAAISWKYIPMVVGTLLSFFQQVDASVQNPDNNVVCSEVHS